MTDILNMKLSDFLEISLFKKSYKRGGKIHGDIGKITKKQYGYTLQQYEKQGKQLFVSPAEYWKNEKGTKYTDFIGRTQTVTESDKQNIMNAYAYRIMIGIDLGSKLIPLSAKQYAQKNYKFENNNIEANI